MKPAAILAAVLAHAVPLAQAAAQEPPRPADAVAPPAPAQPPAWTSAQPQRSTQMYVNLQAGMYQPRGDFLGVIEFNNGLELDATFGAQIHRNVALEGGIGYYGASTDTM